MTASTPATTGLTAEAYADRLFQARIATFETLSVYVGDRLGWYRSLVNDGPATARERAAGTGTQERYCLEWLEMQASYGTLTVDHGATRGDNRFTLPPGPAEVLTDVHAWPTWARCRRSSPPSLRSCRTCCRPTGRAAGELGPVRNDAREAQAALNRPWFESQLAPALARCPGVPDILGAPGARIVDVGCGAGWSTIALARAYPDAVLTGFDVDPPSLEMARAAAEQAGVADRVSFRLAGGATLPR